ncbi:MAG: DUF6922 domain-containing protein [Candidatus Omnitrophota bacterium]
MAGNVCQIAMVSGARLAPQNPLQTKLIVCYNMNMAYAIEKFKSLFWDCNITRININENRTYIIERILEYGDNEPVKWMFETYPLQEVKKVLKESRALSKKSSNFWRLVLKKTEPIPNPAENKI